MPTSRRRPRARALAALVAATALSVPLLAAPASAAPHTVSGVMLEWTGSAALQKAPPVPGTSHYFSAGSSDGTAGTYRAGKDNVQVVHRTTSGSLSAASWATRNASTSGQTTQSVRLRGGTAVVQDDGSAVVSFTGTFTVNAYGGMVPFSITDPRVVIAADGTGELVADLGGYSSSQDDPDVKVPLTPRPDVTVSTFSGAAFHPLGTTTITPRYAGVSVTAPAGQPTQVRTGAGWGSWPQEYVDFQGRTGLGSYWYSSGGAADAYKAPSAFTLTVAPTSTIVFADVPSGTQFFTEIGWLAARGVTAGWEQPDGRRLFAPVTSINRDAMAAFLYRLAGSPSVALPATSPFTDVGTDNQFYREIVWLSQQGISSGWQQADGTRTFGPLQAVNRDAMAAFLYRFAGSPSFDATGRRTFADVTPTTQFHREIEWLAARGISTGWGSGSTRTYKPVDPVNRDAMAAFLYRHTTQP